MRPLKLDCLHSVSKFLACRTFLRMMLMYKAIMRLRRDLLKKTRLRSVHHSWTLRTLLLLGESRNSSKKYLSWKKSNRGFCCRWKAVIEINWYLLKFRIHYMTISMIRKKRTSNYTSKWVS
eukprot:Rmarinus@m.18761